MTPAAAARLGVLLGSVLFVVGVGMAAGVAVALMTAGAGLVAYCLLLAEVDPGDRAGRRSQ